MLKACQKSQIRLLARFLFGVWHQSKSTYEAVGDEGGAVIGKRDGGIRPYSMLARVRYYFKGSFSISKVVRNIFGVVLRTSFYVIFFTWL